MKPKNSKLEHMEAPPSSEPTTETTPTAPPRRCEGARGGGSKTTLRRAPPPEKRSTARKLQPPLLYLQNAGYLQPKDSYTMYRTRDEDPPASRRRGGRRRPRDPTNRAGEVENSGGFQKSPSPVL